MTPRISRRIPTLVAGLNILFIIPFLLSGGIGLLIGFTMALIVVWVAFAGNINIETPVKCLTYMKIAVVTLLLIVAGTVNVVNAIENHVPLRDFEIEGRCSACTAGKPE